MPRKRCVRPYGADVVDEVRRRLGAGEPLRAICAQPSMPTAATVRRWRRSRPEFDAVAPPAQPARSTAVRLTGPLLDEICHRIANGEFLTGICRDRHMPARETVHRRVRTDAAFRGRYAEARALQVEHLFEQIVSIADEDENPVRARLRIEVRKWLVAKLDPRRFGDKELPGKGGAPELIERLEKGRTRTGNDG